MYHSKEITVENWRICFVMKSAFTLVINCLCFKHFFLGDLDDRKLSWSPRLVFFDFKKIDSPQYLFERIPNINSWNIFLYFFPIHSLESILCAELALNRSSQWCKFTDIGSSKENENTVSFSIKNEIVFMQTIMYDTHAFAFDDAFAFAFYVFHTKKKSSFMEKVFIIIHPRYLLW